MSCGSFGDLLSGGYVSRPDAIAEVRELVGDPRSGPAQRALRVAVAGGVSVEILPGRGLDLGSLWYMNQPLAWRSPMGVRGATVDPAGEGWIGRFTGGMVVTCGVDWIGPGPDGHGLHGSHHGTPAEDVTVRRTKTGDVVVEGTVDSARVFGRRVYVHRTITVVYGRGELRIADRVVNDGTTEAAVPLLYHVNFGAPFLEPGTRVRLDAEHHVPRGNRDAAVRWEAFPEPQLETAEWVWEHSGFETDIAGQAAVRLDSVGLGLTCALTWDAHALPRCMEWLYPTRGGWALGIEPSNAPLFGPDRLLPHHGAPVLEPGADSVSGVALRFEPTQPER